MKYSLRFVGSHARSYPFAGQPYFLEVRAAEAEGAACFETMRSAYPDIREFQVVEMNGGKVVASGPHA